MTAGKTLLEVFVGKTLVGKALLESLDKITEVGGDFLPIGTYGMDSYEVEKMVRRKANKIHGSKYSIMKSYSIKN
ncbi:MAG: hypothetical protein KC516_04560 [Nanoarchaeota archaeon]|nr:hypothetical protein [Nanoarchaeota archaeon]